MSKILDQIRKSRRRVGFSSYICFTGRIQITTNSNANKIPALGFASVSGSNNQKSCKIDFIFFLLREWLGYGVPCPFSLN